MTGLEFLGMAMLLVMLAAIFIGLPISFTLLFLALIFGYFGLGVRVFDLAYLQTFGLMKQDEFVAVPMFILMGYVCDQAGLMERLFKAFRDLFAPVRGSLYLVVIVTATLFGIAAGTVGATVALLGIMAGPMMIRAGYDVRMSAGAIAAGGTLGILIPPSVMLVVMAPVLDISIIDLYAAAFGPGFLLSGMYIVYTLARSYWNPKLGPPVPMDERPESMKVVLWECLVGLLPVTILTIMTLGRHSRRPDDRVRSRGTWRARRHPARHRLRHASPGRGCSTPATTRSRRPAWCCSLRSPRTSSAPCSRGSAPRPGSPTRCWRRRCPPWGTMTLLLTVIFLLGWPFEWPAIVLIFLPLLAPVAKGLGYDMVWFGCIVAVVLQTAFLSPPVAMSAYYLKQVVKEWNLRLIYRGMADFMVIQVICVVLVLAFPQIAMWFPNWLDERRKAQRSELQAPPPSLDQILGAANITLVR